jgi:hypothetical protein
VRSRRWKKEKPEHCGGTTYHLAQQGVRDPTLHIGPPAL